MTPDIKSLVQFIDQSFPRLRVDNTYRTIGELTQRVIELGGVEYAPIGKTAGESQWLPPGFIPYSVTLPDKDNINRTVTITGWSHDAVWHLPSRTQIKLISNSAANSDPDPAIHGVGNIACYLIDQANYRWHNPPVPLANRPGLPSPNPALPIDHPSQPPAQGILAKSLALEFLNRLDALYGGDAGLQRVLRGRLDDGRILVLSGMIRTREEAGVVYAAVDTEAVAQWFFSGVIEGQSFDQITTQIQLSDEFRRKHGLI